MNKQDTDDLKLMLADAGRVKERMESDQIVRWDGRILYVVERVFRGDMRMEDRRKDVSEDVAKAVSKLLGS